jgi:hypothetical protein
MHRLADRTALVQKQHHSLAVPVPKRIPSNVDGVASYAGAHHSLRAAVAMLPVNRILLINPENFFWHEGATLDELQPADVVRNPSVYRERVYSATAGKRLLSGRGEPRYPLRLLLPTRGTADILE